MAHSTGSSGTWTTHNTYFSDGNGNITYMLNSSQAMVASYRYDPFGNSISSTGTLAGANVYRFSSKEYHAVSGMYYYLYRFYDPNLQRWINRDPLGDYPGIRLTLRLYDPARLNSYPARLKAIFRFQSLLLNGLISGAWSPSERWEGVNLYICDGNDSINHYDISGLSWSALWNGVEGGFAGLGTGILTGMGVGAAAGCGVGSLPGAAVGGIAGGVTGFISGFVGGLAVGGNSATPDSLTKAGVVGGACGVVVGGVSAACMKGAGGSMPPPDLPLPRPPTIPGSSPQTPGLGMFDPWDWDFGKGNPWN